MKYSKYELLFCLNEKSDPALNVIEALKQRYPNISTKTFIGGEVVGLNPKINNIMPAYRDSTYPFILISDSGIYMRDNALTDMVSCMEDNVAMVTQLPYCFDRSGFSANLEQIFFGSAHARIYMAGHALNFVCSTGMSSLIRKETLEYCGGLQYFGAFLAEDYFFGVEFVKRGWKTAVSHMPALQNNANITPRIFFGRMCRWAQLRIAMLPHTIVLEPLQECVMSSILGAIAVAFITQSVVYMIAFLIFHMGYWIVCDYILLTIVQNNPLPFNIFQFLIVWIIRELISFPIYITALINSDINWRSGTYRLHWGGRIITNKRRIK